MLINIKTLAGSQGYKYAIDLKDNILLSLKQILYMNVT